jgi:hypothetical protein
MIPFVWLIYQEKSYFIPQTRQGSICIYKMQWLTNKPAMSPLYVLVVKRND